MTDEFGGSNLLAGGAGARSLVLEPNARAPDAGALEDALRCRQQETRLKMKLLKVSGAPGVCAHAARCDRRAMGCARPAMPCARAPMRQAPHFPPGAFTRSQDQLHVLVQLSEASQLSGSSGESQNQSTSGTNEEVMLTASFVDGHEGQDFPSPSAAAMFLQHQVQIDIQQAISSAQQVGARAGSTHGKETSLCVSKQRPPVVTNASVASSSSSTVLDCDSASSMDAALAGAMQQRCKRGNSNNTSPGGLAALQKDAIEQDEEVAHVHDAALRMRSVWKKVT